MSVRLFGTLEGRDVHEVSLRSPDGLEARIISWGAVIRDLVVPGPGGRQRVVLGYETLEHYVEHSPYFGAVVGRYANRIGGARFTLDGETHRLVPNEGPNQLHGGPQGFGQRVWTLLHHDEGSAVLGLVSEDGDMGYPGRLVATCSYTLSAPATLRITLEATCDQATPVNLTTHSYFNFDGGPDICAHALRIEADHITPVDDALIPTGAITPVAQTAFDFRALRPIGAPDGCTTRYDHNFVLRHGGGPLAPAATLASARSGVAMDLWTTEPGLQFYGGHLLDSPVPGLEGARYAIHGGLCLEPQRFPDGPNHGHFPRSILRPGELSRQVSELRFRPMREDEGA
ncbi:aldose epimerase family protein [Salinarimonas soli]|uniref:Aldose 1-epimerase n=1 Tax=Salinarimonas soli TaxID=1638099 RepID=A0A5B2V679_9HYPH|nr:aldose epimerase family protein [Salinarimonas soli]KAA2235033.1 galactose mutarotase [Salinarimonas soli]